MLKSFNQILIIFFLGMVEAMVFPVVMYGYEGWTIKKVEH